MLVQKIYRSIESRDKYYVRVTHIVKLSYSSKDRQRFQLNFILGIIKIQGDDIHSIRLSNGKKFRQMRLKSIRKSIRTRIEYSPW